MKERLQVEQDISGLQNLAPRSELTTAVIPAKAGIHFRLCLWPLGWTASLPTGGDTDASYIRLIRSGFGHGASSRESESNAKTESKNHKIGFRLSPE